MNGENGFIPQEPATTSGGVFSDFLTAAQSRVSEISQRFTSRPTDTQSSVGGSIFEALYAFGAGKADAARQKAATALLQSKQGQRFVGEVERQRIQQLLPFIIGGAILLLFVGVAFGRR